MQKSHILYLQRESFRIRVRQRRQKTDEETFEPFPLFLWLIKLLKSNVTYVLSAAAAAIITDASAAFFKNVPTKTMELVLKP